MPHDPELDALLRSLAPTLDDVAYAFVVLRADDPLLDRAFAIVREREGASGIVPLAEAHAEGRQVAFVAARITLTVASQLDAVGLTAAVAQRLTDERIACNVVAGLHHDHLFVPWNARMEALEALQRLASER